MGNTHRKNKRTGKLERDGYRAAISAGCEHNGWCPWCRGNRLYNSRKTEEYSIDAIENHLEDDVWHSLHADIEDYLNIWIQQYLQEVDMDIELPETDWENYRE